MSLYHTLGVAADAPIQDITRAYRALSIDCHPDRNNGKLTAEFQRISDAYYTLTDTGSRQKYDESVCRKSESSMLCGFVKDDNIFPSDFQGRLLSVDPFSATKENSAAIDVYRPFPKEGCVVRNGISTYIVSTKIPPIVVIALLSLKHCYLGCSLPIIVTRQITGGMFKSPAKAALTNLPYIGERVTGEREDSVYNADSSFSETETITAYFPQGVGDKDIIVLEGAGNSIGASTGDVNVVIQVKPDPVFSVYGLDLVFQKHLTLKEALCGFTFSQLHPCGKMVVIENITAPSVIYPGYRRTMFGMGMIRYEKTGNMIVEFIVDFPKRLCSEKIRALADAL